MLQQTSRLQTVSPLKQPVGDDVTALVLSGGGARGAYAVGVLQAVVEILGLTAKDRSLFQIYSGTSVGSINAAFLASHAQRGDLGIYKLREVWETLGVNSHLKVLGNVGDLRGLSTGWFANSLLDSGPLQELVQGNVDFEQLHENVDSGRVRSLMLAAFNIGTAQTTIFCESHHSFEPRPSRDPTRFEVHTAIHADHVLASAAMPFVFPARKIDDHYYCDGGVRFNTPISPAIRAGASRLMVISLNPLRQHAPERDPLVGYPSVPFLMGRLLDALLLDPFEYDLEVLERFNRLSTALQEALPRHTLERIRQVLVDTRGAPYHNLKTLVFSPSEDLGRLANEHLKQYLPSYKLGAIPRYFLKKAANPNARREANWAAYLLFDGKFAERLVQLGIQDTFARRDEIVEFFTAPGPQPGVDSKR